MIEIHDHAIELTPAEAGMMSRSLLESAVNAPKQAFFYSDCDLFDLAAAYLYHIAKAHAFANGNKRTAYVSALTFLELNGAPISRSSSRLEDATVDAVADAITKAQVAEILRSLASCDD